MIPHSISNLLYHRQVSKIVVPTIFSSMYRDNGLRSNRNSRILERMKIDEENKKILEDQAKNDEKEREEKKESKGGFCAYTVPQGQNPLIPYLMPSVKKNIQLTPCMKQDMVPKFNESLIMVGCSGSGKTNTLLWMLTHTHLMDMSMMDEVYLFSFTGKADKSFALLKLDKKNIFSSDLGNNLEKVFEKQKKDIENGGKKNIMIILEDITSSPKVLRSPIFTRVFTAGRHYRITPIAVCHKYRVIPRVSRLNAMNIILFPSQTTELEAIYEDHAPPKMNKKEMYSMMDYAFTPTEQDKRPFLYINLKAPFKTRFRKGFNCCLEI